MNNNQVLVHCTPDQFVVPLLVVHRVLSLGNRQDEPLLQILRTHLWLVQVLVLLQQSGFVVLIQLPSVSVVDSLLVQQV